MCELDPTSVARLANGVSMPMIGYGTYKILPGEQTRRCVASALKVGYRHIDTATYYHNEADIGVAVRESGVSRDEVFITTKCWNSDQGYEEALKAFDRSINALGMDHVDLYLIHWPVPDKYLDTWDALEDIYRSGRAKAIGVSNFLEHHLEYLLQHCSIKPMVDQVEFHPHLVQPELMAYLSNNGIQIVAWSPLKQGRIAVDRALSGIGWRYGKTAAQTAIRWDLQHHVVTIPRTIRPERMKENMKVFDFSLSDADMRTIDSLDRKERIGPDPDLVDF